MGEGGEKDAAQSASVTLARLGEDFALAKTISPESLADTLLPAKSGTSVANALQGQDDLNVVREIAVGGMGRVLLAHQPSLLRDVAVKTVRPDLSDARLSLALLEESRIAGSLEHPNIIPIHSLGKDSSGAPFLVMKKVEGVAWAEMLERDDHPGWGRIGVRDNDRLVTNLEILSAVARAVHYAHCQGIVHRDIKPENVMIGQWGEIYLVDWGIATALISSDPRYRKPRLGLVGTPGFLAPEMISDDGGSVDERSDVYLLGATLHYVLTNRLRHRATTLSMCFVEAMQSEPFEYAADIPIEIGNIANRACHRMPSERYPSALSFAEAVLDFVRHRASISLADAARAKLNQLQSQWLAAQSDPVDAGLSIQQELRECQLGFLHALESWHDNERAKSGLRACTLLSLEDDLSKRNLVGAEAALRELPDAPAHILEAMTALRAEVHERDQLALRQREYEQREDWTTSAGARGAFFAIVLAVGVGLWQWANEGQAIQPKLLSPWRLAAPVGVALVVLSLLAVVLRKRIQRTRINEQLIYGTLLLVATIFLNRVSNMWPVSYAATLISNELTLCAFAAAIGALVLVRWLWWVVPIWLAGVVVVRLEPSVAGLTFVCCTAISLVYIAWASRR